MGFLEFCHIAGFRIVDTDDFIGALNFNISVNTNGYLNVNYTNPERCVGVYSWNNTPNAMIIHLNGDGSDYKLYVQFYFM